MQQETASPLDTSLLQQQAPEPNRLSSTGQFNDAPISREDVERAGGLGARDALSSAAPVHMDATDIEEELGAFEDRQPQVLTPDFGPSGVADTPEKLAATLGLDPEKVHFGEGGQFSTADVAAAANDALEERFELERTDSELDALDEGVDGRAGKWARDDE